MPYRLKSVIFSLGLASSSCLFMTLFRAEITGNDFYSFLVWNLFLAWIPLGVALSIDLFYSHHRFSKAMFVLLVFVWFIFFPNAPYIVTDFIHLKVRPGIPLIFDTIIIFSYATTGLFAGLVSLHILQERIAKIFSRGKAWAFVFVVLTSSSFGVYLGRFLRWNSWDVFTHPILLAQDMLGTFVNPLIYTKISFMFTGVLSLFLASIYFILHSLISSRRA